MSAFGESKISQNCIYFDKFAHCGHPQDIIYFGAKKSSDYILIGTYILVYNKGDFYMEILHVYGKVFNFRDVILHMLHVTGGKRCSPMVKGCMVGCAVEGGFNGKPDEKSKPLLNLDTTGEYLNFSLNPISPHSNPASFLLTNILHLLLYKQKFARQHFDPHPF